MATFRVTSDPNDLDINLTYSFISNTYWAKNIPFETFEKSIKNSLIFGAYDQQGQQVGFARVITDKATFAYLGDVFVLEHCRGQGVSKLIMQAVCAHPDLQGLRRFMLATRDAHGLYAQFGFEQVVDSQSLMQRLQPDIYKQ